MAGRGGPRRSPAERVCVGRVTGAHGVRGAVRVVSYTAAPGDIAAYAPLTDEAGARRFRLRLQGRSRGALIAAIEGVETREAAEALKGLGLYVPRGALPPPEDEEEFYHADLIGLAAETVGGAALGRVRAVHNFGAGDVLEIAPEGARGAGVMVPFTRAAVPVVDLGAGRLTVEPVAAGLDERPTDSGEEDAP